MILEDDFDEKYYLEHSPDVARAVLENRVPSAYIHYTLFGEKEKRPSRKKPRNSLRETGTLARDDKLRFYALSDTPEFGRIITADNVIEAIADHLDSVAPTAILETLN